MAASVTFYETKDPFFPHEDPSQEHYPLKKANKARGLNFLYSHIMEIRKFQCPEVRTGNTDAHIRFCPGLTPVGHS